MDEITTLNQKMNNLQNDNRDVAANLKMANSELE